MVNLKKLRGLILEKGYTTNDIAIKMGVNRATFYRKMNNGGKGFLIYEAQIIVEYLELTKEEAIMIFFADYVA